MDVPRPQAQITEHRRFPASLFQESREVPPERVRLKPDQVADDRYTVRTSDAGCDLPLRSRQDLRELRFFTGAGPAEGLDRPGLALSIAQLADLGWKFFASTTAGVAEVGRYGAYNALTDGGFALRDVEARLGPNTAPLQADTPERMAAFYATPDGRKLHELESAGYSYFDGAGRATGAFGPALEVGREEPWLRVDPADVPRLGGALAAFEGFRQAAPGLELARKAWTFAQGYQPGAVPDTDILPVLGADPRFGPIARLCRDVSGSESTLQVLAPHIGATAPAEVRAAALAVLEPGRYVSSRVRAAVAGGAVRELAADPACAPAARLLDAMGDLNDDLRAGVADLLLRRPEVAESAKDMLALANEVARVPRSHRQAAALEAPFARAVELSPGDAKLAEASALLAGVQDAGLRDAFLVELATNREAGLDVAVAKCLRKAASASSSAARELGLAQARKGSPDRVRLVDALVAGTQEDLLLLTALLEAGPKVDLPGFARELLGAVSDKQAGVLGPRLFAVLTEPAAVRTLAAARLLAKPESQGRLFRHMAQHPEESSANLALAARAAAGADKTFSSDRDFAAGARLVDHFLRAPSDRERLALADGASDLARYALGYYLLATPPATPLSTLAQGLLQELPAQDGAPLGRRILEAVSREEGPSQLADGAKHLLVEGLGADTQVRIEKALLERRAALGSSAEVKALAREILADLFQAGDRTRAGKGFLSWLREDPALTRDVDLVLAAARGSAEGAALIVVEGFLGEGTLGERLAGALEKVGRNGWNHREGGRTARAWLAATEGDDRFVTAREWLARLAPEGSPEETAFVVGWASLRYADRLSTREGSLEAGASLLASLSPSTAGDLPRRVLDHLGQDPGLRLASRLVAAVPEHEQLRFATRAVDGLRAGSWKEGLPAAGRALAASLVEHSAAAPEASKQVLAWLAETPPYSASMATLAGLAMREPEDIVKVLEDLDALLADRPGIEQSEDGVRVGDVSLPIAAR